MPDEARRRARHHTGPAAGNASSPADTATLPDAAPVVALPSEKHRRFLQLLHATARPGAGGYPVSSWWQRDLAKRLQVHERTLKRLVADLREPGPPDPRHPRATRAAGRRLGLLKVEPTHYHAEGGQYRRGHNLYVLLVPPQVVAILPIEGQWATWPFDLTSGNGEGVALGKQEKPLSLEEEGEYSWVPIVERAGPAVEESYPQVGTTAADSDIVRGLLTARETQAIIAAAESWGIPRAEALALARQRRRRERSA
jgi:hypothetical protein